MSFIRHHGEPNIFGGYLKTASTALTKDTVVAFNGSGTLVAATASTNPAAIAGIIQRDVLSTDSDYASSVPVDVEVPRQKEDFFIADVEAGTLTQAIVGTRIDLNDAAGINIAGTSKLQVFVEQVLNTTGGASSLGQALVTFPGINAA